MNKSRIQTLPFKPCRFIRSDTFHPKIFRLKINKNQNFKPWTFKPCRLFHSETFRSKIFRLKTSKNQESKPWTFNP